MKIIFTFLISLSFIALTTQAAVNSFDKKTFYAALKNGTLSEINALLKLAKASTITEKDAYVGTLLMKKAGLVPNPIDKLGYFKTGHSKLEDYIKKDNDNPEWRFLRLVIQENAPKVVNYNDNIKEDVQFIRTNFKKLSAEAQIAVKDFSKISKNLPADSFQ